MEPFAFCKLSAIHLDAFKKYKVIARIAIKLARLTLFFVPQGPSGSLLAGGHKLGIKEQGSFNNKHIVFNYVLILGIYDIIYIYIYYMYVCRIYYQRTFKFRTCRFTNF